VEIIFDLVIQNGTVFDGQGSPGVLRHVGIRHGHVTAISFEPLSGTALQIIDANGCWVMPGFVDLHTHYDAEIEMAPELSESLRHGVTSVIIGSCSLGLVPGTPEVLADIFCRVEAVPYDAVRRLLETKKTWNTVEDYLNHLDATPLGPNVASYLGHSSLRAHVMGVERSLDKQVRPTEKELLEMESITERALDAGYLGVSFQTSLWDKMGGDREYRSKPLPSSFASWSEYRRLTKILRRRGAIFQGVPNLTTRINVFLFLWESVGLFRKKLKTTVISMMDVRSDRTVYRLVGWFSRFFNRLGADFKWQALPEAFDLWADGMDLVVFEEFGAGAAALHFEDPEERRKLLREPGYRKWFRSQWRNPLLPKAFHRNLALTEILECPDASLVGKSFPQIATERGRDTVETFLDLMAEHGTRLRWYTVMGNDRAKPLEHIISHPDVLIGFSDAGAHLRNMAHYNYPLRMLRLVRDAERAGRSIMTTERAVYKLTGEIANWMNLDAGKIAVGARADIAVIDPANLNAQVDAHAEADMPGIPGLVRLVRRNDEVVRAVLVNGRLASERGRLRPEVGKERGFGSALRAKNIK